MKREKVRLREEKERERQLKREKVRLREKKRERE